MFKFKLPAFLDPMLARRKAQEEVDQRHEQIAVARNRQGLEEMVAIDVPLDDQEATWRARCEQLRHPEADVDGQLDVTPMREVTKEERRRQELKAARLRNEYNQKRGTK